MNCLLYYTEKTKISPQFLDEWKHYKRIGLPRIRYCIHHVGWFTIPTINPNTVCRTGRPVLVTHDAYSNRFYSNAGAPKKPTDVAQITESKSNVAGSGSSVSDNRSHREDIEAGSRASQLELAGDELSDTVL